MKITIETKANKDPQVFEINNGEKWEHPSMDQHPEWASKHNDKYCYLYNCANFNPGYECKKDGEGCVASIMSHKHCFRNNVQKACHAWEWECLITGCEQNTLPFCAIHGCKSAESPATTWYRGKKCEKYLCINFNYQQRCYMEDDNYECKYEPFKGHKECFEEKICAHGDTYTCNVTQCSSFHMMESHRCLESGKEK